MERQLPRAAKSTIDLSEYVTATEYCTAKGISAPTLYRQLKRGEGPETIRVAKNCQLFRLPQRAADNEYRGDRQ
jgi:hypothetical protein